MIEETDDDLKKERGMNLRGHTEYILQEIIKDFEFEKLASECMYKYGYVTIDPRGGSRDGGIDAVSVIRNGESSDGKRIIFHYSTEKDWERKLNMDVKKDIKNNEPKSTKLVFCTTQRIRGTKKSSVPKEILKKYGYEIEVFDLPRFQMMLDNNKWGMDIKERYGFASVPKSIKVKKDKTKIRTVFVSDLSKEMPFDSNILLSSLTFISDNSIDQGIHKYHLGTIRMELQKISKSTTVSEKNLECIVHLVTFINDKLKSSVESDERNSLMNFVMILMENTFTKRLAVKYCQQTLENIFESKNRYNFQFILPIMDKLGLFGISFWDRIGWVFRAIDEKDRSLLNYMLGKMGQQNRTKEKIQQAINVLNVKMNKLISKDDSEIIDLIQQFIRELREY